MIKLIHKNAQLKRIFEKLPALKIPGVLKPSFNFQESIAFIPGVFFILMGLATLIAPNFFIGLLAGFFLFLGAIMCFCGWKIVRLRQRFVKLAREFEGRIIIQGVDLSPQFEQEEYREAKKIILH